MISSGCPYLVNGVIVMAGKEGVTMITYPADFSTASATL